MRTFLLALFVSFISFNTFSQGCLPDGITFSSQAEIDNFSTNYPGCTEILGSVTIHGSDIQNLQGLISIKKIQGALRVGIYSGGNNMLSNLQGLDSLIYVGDNITIENNNILESLTGLEGLTQVTKSLQIQYNGYLQDLHGLDNVTYVGHSFNLIDNSSLTDLTGLGSLDSINMHFSITRNDNLTSLNGANQLRYIGVEGLFLRENDNLTDLTAFYKLVSCDAITVTLNSAIESLYGLDNMNPDLISFIEIHNNPYLSVCEIQSICEALSNPDTDISILSNATGCDNVEEVEERCNQGLPMCMPFGVTFTSQAQINDFLIDHPTCTEIEGDVIISGNDITSLYGLHNIVRIGGKLDIYDCESLSDFYGLNDLTNIGGDLIFENNQVLSDLSALLNLEIISGDLKVLGNEQLTSLTGLDSIAPESIENMFVSDNPNLSECSVISVCVYIINPAGFTVIGNNAPGCENVDQIYEECFLSSQEIQNENSLVIFPNPVVNTLNMRFKKNHSIENVSIYNNVGKKILSFNESVGKYDVSMLKAGIYYVEVKSGKDLFRNKIIVIE